MGRGEREKEGEKGREKREKEIMKKEIQTEKEERENERESKQERQRETETESETESETEGDGETGKVVLTMFLTHLLACPCGSMNSDQRRENSTMTPFSTDKLSFGSPQICQLRILTGSLMVEMRLGSSVRGTLFSSSSLTQCCVMSWRYSPCTQHRVTVRPVYTQIQVRLHLFF